MDLTLYYKLKKKYHLDDGEWDETKHIRAPKGSLIIGKKGKEKGKVIAGGGRWVKVNDILNADDPEIAKAIEEQKPNAVQDPEEDDDDYKKENYESNEEDKGHEYIEKKVDEHIIYLRNNNMVIESYILKNLYNFSSTLNSIKNGNLYGSIRNIFNTSKTYDIDIRNDIKLGFVKYLNNKNVDYYTIGDFLEVAKDNNIDIKNEMDKVKSALIRCLDLKDIDEILKIANDNDINIKDEAKSLFIKKLDNIKYRYIRKLVILAENNNINIKDEVKSFLIEHLNSENVDTQFEVSEILDAARYNDIDIEYECASKYIELLPEESEIKDVCQKIINGEEIPKDKSYKFYINPNNQTDKSIGYEEHQFIGTLLKQDSKTAFEHYRGSTTVHINKWLYDLTKEWVKSVESFSDKGYLTMYDIRPIFEAQFCDTLEEIEDYIQESVRLLDDQMKPAPFNMEFRREISPGELGYAIGMQPDILEALINNIQNAKTTEEREMFIDIIRNGANTNSNNPTVIEWNNPAFQSITWNLKSVFNRPIRFDYTIMQGTDIYVTSNIAEQEFILGRNCNCKINLEDIYWDDTTKSLAFPTICTSGERTPIEKIIEEHKKTTPEIDFESLTQYRPGSRFIDATSPERKERLENAQKLIERHRNGEDKKILQTKHDSVDLERLIKRYKFMKKKYDLLKKLKRIKFKYKK